MWPRPLAELVAGSAPSLSTVSHCWESRWEELLSLGLAAPDCRVDEDRRIPHHPPGPLGTAAWPRQPIQPYLPKCPSTVEQSCEGSGAHCTLFAASELFLAARYWAGGERPSEHAARSGPSPAPGLLLLLPSAQGCWTNPPGA